VSSRPIDHLGDNQVVVTDLVVASHPARQMCQATSEQRRDGAPVG
jgi:hypothetical protein